MKNLGMSSEALTARLFANPVQVGEFNAARVAAESCRIFGTPKFYPDRNIAVAYIERFTRVMEGILAVWALEAAVLDRLAHPR